MACVLKWGTEIMSEWAIQDSFPSLPIAMSERYAILTFCSGSRRMSKQDLIECIREINRGARQDFLDQFSEQELDMYLEHLMEVDLEEMALSA